MSKICVQIWFPSVLYLYENAEISLVQAFVFCHKCLNSCQKNQYLQLCVFQMVIARRRRSSDEAASQVSSEASGDMSDIIIDHFSAERGMDVNILLKLCFFFNFCCFCLLLILYLSAFECFTNFSGNFSLFFKQFFFNRGN